MEYDKRIIPERSNINFDLILHMHNCIFLVRQGTEDEFEAQPKRM